MMYKTKAPRTSVHGFWRAVLFATPLPFGTSGRSIAGRYCPESENQDVTTAAMNALLQLLESGGDIDFDRRPRS